MLLVLPVSTQLTQMLTPVEYSWIFYRCLSFSSFGNLWGSQQELKKRDHWTVPKLSEYLTVKEAAEYLGVSPNTLRNWGRDGKIAERCHPVNGYRLYSQKRN